VWQPQGCFMRTTALTSRPTRGKGNAEQLALMGYNESHDLGVEGSTIIVKQNRSLYSQYE